MIEKLREKANNLPLLPGVYIMKDAKGEVIYVGKAKALKNRVSSYFRGEHLPKVEAMVQKVEDFDVVIAQSEFEALVLENSLIKRHMPYYNILLRDDKGYPFIRLDTKSAYPTFSVVSRMAEDGAKYFGPFGGRGVSFDIIDTLCKALQLPTCSRKFPRDIGKARPCLNKHMGACKGYCQPETDAGEYMPSIKAAEMVLNGKIDSLKEELNEKMLEASENLRFEVAAQYRDRLKAIDALSNKQRMIATAYADMDVIGFFRGERTCFAVMHYKDGDFAGKDFSIVDDPLEEDAEALSKFLSQYYGYRSTWARTILLPCDIEDCEELSALLSNASGHRVAIEVPKRGDRRSLVENADANAREETLRAENATQRRNKLLELLEKTLDLPTLPRRIESFDISNTGNFGIVAAMVVFVDGKPLKRDYRKFRIKSTETQDDYASMYEAVSRRYARCVEGEEGFEEVPDLVLIDGGQAHTDIAIKALDVLGLKLPVFGMVKDDRHRTRALITGGGEEISISANQALFSFIGKIQEETHRFAIEYHRSLRTGTITSGLDKIPGVGEKRRNALLKHFKTIKAVSQADVQKLQEVLPQNAAQAVYDYYHGGEEAAED